MLLHSFLDPNFDGSYSAVSATCKYWYKICRRLLNTKSEKKKVTLKSVKAPKGKRSALQNMIQPIQNLEEHKKSLKALSKKQKDEEAKILYEFERQEESDMKKMDDDMLASRQRQQRIKDEAANEFYFMQQANLLKQGKSLSREGVSAKALTTSRQEEEEEESSIFSTSFTDGNNADAISFALAGTSITVASPEPKKPKVSNIEDSIKVTKQKKLLAESKNLSKAKKNLNATALKASLDGSNDMQNSSVHSTASDGKQRKSLSTVGNKKKVNTAEAAEPPSVASTATTATEANEKDKLIKKGTLDLSRAVLKPKKKEDTETAGGVVARKKKVGKEKQKSVSANGECDASNAKNKKSLSSRQKNSKPSSKDSQSDELVKEAATISFSTPESDFVAGGSLSKANNDSNLGSDTTKGAGGGGGWGSFFGYGGSKPKSSQSSAPSPVTPAPAVAASSQESQQPVVPSWEGFVNGLIGATAREYTDHRLTPKKQSSREVIEEDDTDVLGQDIEEEVLHERLNIEESSDDDEDLIEEMRVVPDLSVLKGIANDIVVVREEEEDEDGDEDEDEGDETHELTAITEALPTEIGDEKLQQNEENEIEEEVIEDDIQKVNDLVDVNENDDDDEDLRRVPTDQLLEEIMEIEVEIEEPLKGLSEHAPSGNEELPKFPERTSTIENLTQRFEKENNVDWGKVDYLEKARLRNLDIGDSDTDGEDSGGGVGGGRVDNDDELRLGEEKGEVYAVEKQREKLKAAALMMSRFKY